jgi:DNA polymerase-3 subunit delta
VTGDELRRELDAGTLRPAYLLSGEEALVRDDALERIRESVLADGPADFNFDRLEGDATSPGALLDALRTLPVMAQRRLVVLREPQGQGRARKANEVLLEAIAEGVSSLGEESSTVLVVVASKVDRRARWVKAFGAPAAEVRCDPPKGQREVVAFVRNEAKRQGVAFERGAAELLAERTGPQLLMLRQEISKLALLAGEGHEISRSHVASGTCDVAEEPIWDLTDAIGAGRTSDAMVVLTKLLRSGAAPPLVLGALVSHFRRLLRVSAGAAVPGPPFVVKKLETQARRYSQGRLASCLRAIHETDTALKGAGSLRPEMALERLVLGLSA